MLARENILEIIESAKCAIENINKPDDELTELDLQKALGQLDIVKFELEAAQILLREGIYERREKGNDEVKEDD